jgi:hypothetical protein
MVGRTLLQTAKHLLGTLTPSQRGRTSVAYLNQATDDQLNAFIRTHGSTPPPPYNTFFREPKSIAEQRRCAENRPLSDAEEEPSSLSDTEEATLVDLLKRLYDYPEFYHERGTSAPDPTLPKEFLLSFTMVTAIKRSMVDGHAPECKVFYDGVITTLDAAFFRAKNDFSFLGHPLLGEDTVASGTAHRTWILLTRKTLDYVTRYFPICEEILVLAYPGEYRKKQKHDVHWTASWNRTKINRADYLHILQSATTILENNRNKAPQASKDDVKQFVKTLRRHTAVPLDFEQELVREMERLGTRDPQTMVRNWLEKLVDGDYHLRNLAMSLHNDSNRLNKTISYP